MNTKSARSLFRQNLNLLKTVLAQQISLRQPLFDLSISVLRQHSLVPCAHAACLLRCIRHLGIPFSTNRLLPLLSFGSQSNELALEAVYFLMTASNFDEHATRAVENFGSQLADSKDWWGLYKLACQSLAAGGHSWARFACIWLQLIPKSSLSEHMHQWLCALHLIAQAENALNNDATLVVTNVQDAVQLYHQALLALRSVVFRGQSFGFQTQLVELRLGFYLFFVCFFFCFWEVVV
jgi:hypothetical protein